MPPILIIIYDFHWCLLIYKMLFVPLQQIFNTCQLPMKILGNIIWIIFGGLHIALEYFIAGLVLMVTIVGIPFGLQSLKLGMLAIWPFGSKVRRKIPQPSCLNFIMNIIWFFVGGIWIVLTHLFYGLVFCITIIGIPFGKMHFRLAKLAFLPFGKEIA